MGKRLVVSHERLLRFLFYQYKPCKKMSIIVRMLVLVVIGILFFFLTVPLQVAYFSAALSAMCLLIQLGLLFCHLDSPVVAFTNNAVVFISASIHANLLASILLFGRERPRFHICLLLLVLCMAGLSFLIFRQIAGDKYRQESKVSPMAPMIGVLLSFVVSRIWIASLSDNTIMMIGGICLLLISLLFSMNIVFVIKVILFYRLKKRGEGSHSGTGDVPLSQLETNGK